MARRRLEPRSAAEAGFAFQLDYVGDTALHLAAAGYRVDIVRLLLAAGANPNAAENRRRSSPGAFCVGFRQMNNMKSIRPLVLATALLLGLTAIVAARVVRIWPYQELLEKSDFVVIATPTATNDTKEHVDLPSFPGQPVIGVETRFAVSAVLKGDKALKDFVLHHYRPDRVMVPNGPTFISFTPAENPTPIQRAYILFLLREADGRYAPVVGQTDPGMGVKELVHR